MSDERHAGGCACGAARFEALGAPKFVARCHCRSCRRMTGGAISTWVGFRDENVRWRGARDAYSSSPGVKRSFCRSCGTPLTYQGEKWAGETHFLIGAFDDPSPFTPTADVFTEDKLHWT